MLLFFLVLDGTWNLKTTKKIYWKNLDRPWNIDMVVLVGYASVSEGYLFMKYKTYILTRIGSIGSRTIIQNEYTGEIIANGTQILSIRSQIWSTVLPVEPPLQNPPTGIQLVSHCRAIYFHAGRKYYQLIPLGYLKINIS